MRDSKKTLGVAKNVGELKKMLEKCNDSMSISFGNKPVHELIIADDKLCFTEYRSELYMKFASENKKCPHCMQPISDEYLDLMICDKCNFEIELGSFLEIDDSNIPTEINPIIDEAIENRKMPFSNRLEQLKNGNS